MNGIVKKKTDKGFGFISIEGQAKDLFFHSSALEGITFDELKEGDEVMFEVGDSPKGKCATNMRLA